mgnify:CR=1 FL=1
MDTNISSLTSYSDCIEYKPKRLYWRTKKSSSLEVKTKHIFFSRLNEIPPKPGIGVVLPSAGPEPKIEDDVPDPKSEGVDDPDDPKTLEVAADEDPNKDKLGAVNGEGLAEEKDDAAGVKAGKGDDAEGREGAAVFWAEIGVDAGAAVENIPDTWLEIWLAAAVACRVGCTLLAAASLFATSRLSASRKGLLYSPLFLWSAK